MSDHQRSRHPLHSKRALPRHRPRPPRVRIPVSGGGVFTGFSLWLQAWLMVRPPRAPHGSQGGCGSPEPSRTSGSAALASGPKQQTAFRPSHRARRGRSESASRQRVRRADRRDGKNSTLRKPLQTCPSTPCAKTSPPPSWGVGRGFPTTLEDCHGNPRAPVVSQDLRVDDHMGMARRRSAIRLGLRL